jgi:hypothetical protein
MQFLAISFRMMERAMLCCFNLGARGNWIAPRCACRREEDAPRLMRAVPETVTERAPGRPTILRLPEVDVLEDGAHHGPHESVLFYYVSLAHTSSFWVSAARAISRFALQP